MNDSEYIKVKLHVISPVFIGCDEVYEPTNFVIDEQRNKLIEFDPVDFIKSLAEKEREEFVKSCSSDNLLSIFKNIRRYYKPSIPGRDVNIAKGLLRHYQKVLSMSTFDKKAIINQFTIHKTAFNPQSSLPYIPGSSIKGSLRTACLNLIAEKRGIKDWWDISKAKDKAKELEKELFNGSFDTDPFRMIKISDLLPERDVKTKIVYAINKKKNNSDLPLLADKGPLQIFETIQQGSVFSGTIKIEKPLNRVIKNPVKRDDLLVATHSFYAGVLKDEIKPVNNIGLKHKAGILANKLFENKFKKSAYLIRVGRHSGAEAVTIKRNRRIKIMQGQGNPPKYSKEGSTTFWLASEEARPQSNNGLLPFGWAVLEIVDKRRQ